MIHSTALIDPRAELAEDVTIGPYAILDGPVQLGPGCRVEAHAQLVGDVRVGAGTSIGRGAVIGTNPQDLGFDSSVSSWVEIGENCKLREHVTIHRGSSEGSCTSIGANNFLMVGAHLGHDVKMGRDNIIANAVLLAGHVVIGNQTFLGGGSCFHQFLRIGDSCVVQGNGSFSKDIPHFCAAQRTNQVTGLNVVGLRRQDVTPQERAELKGMFDLLFRSGLNTSQAVAKAHQSEWSERSLHLLRFVEAPSKKGVCAVRPS